jgi:hypothetical protein
MKLKSYFSASVEAAMELARTELGEEALLVNARPATPETRYLGAYEVVFGTPGVPASKPAETSDRPAPADTLSRDVADLKREIERLGGDSKMSRVVHPNSLCLHSWSKTNWIPSWPSR